MAVGRWDWLFRMQGDKKRFVALVQDRTTKEFSLFAGPKEMMINLRDVMQVAGEARSDGSVRVEITGKGLHGMIDVSAGDYTTIHTWINGEQMELVVADKYNFRFHGTSILRIDRESAT